MGEFPSKANQFSSENQPKSNGRKPGRSFKKILEELLEKKVQNVSVKSAKEVIEMFPDGDLTYKEALMVRMIAKAIVEPESKSAERIMNRVEGLPKQTIEQSIVSDEAKIIISKDGKEINLKVKSDKPEQADEKNTPEINE